MFFIQAKPENLDLIFIFGADSQNAGKALAEQKILAERMVDKYHISTPGVLVGAISYDSIARLGWRIGNARDAKSTVESIRSIQRIGRGNNILNALEMARDELLPIPKGARINTPKTLVVFIDKAQEKDEKLEDLAVELKSSGVKVIVVAMGTEVDKKYLGGIASDPSSLHKVTDLLTHPGLPDKIVSQSRPGTYFYVEKHLKMI